MGTTNSTGKELNKHYIEGNALYGVYVAVNTGNQKDSEGKSKNGKYVSGKVKNMTYTLETPKNNYEESAKLLNYYDYVWDNGEYIFGHPNKWVYDSDQKYNNCGVVSALNILSMAGKINMVAPTKEEIEKLTAPVTRKTTDAYGNEIETTKIPKVDFTSSEEKLTLYAIQRNYCNHSLDSSDYKSIKDIKTEDGGTYFADINSEIHQYHDSMKDINAILADYGVSSNTYVLSMHVQADSSFDIDDEVTKSDYNVDEEGNPIESNDTITITGKYTFGSNGNYITKPSGNFLIESTNGSDSIRFNDLTIDEIAQQKFCIVRRENNLIINYNETNYVEIANYYEPTKPDDSFEKTHIRNIYFAGSDTPLSLASVEAYLCAAKGIKAPYTEEAMDTASRQYGYFIDELAGYVRQGKGIVLSGYATEGFNKIDTTKLDTKGGQHAIVLTGVSYKFYDQGNKDDEDLNIFDVDGFYVVDSGHWLDENATGAQFISCDQLYNFLTKSTYLNEANQEKYHKQGRMTYTTMVLTDDSVKQWADDLNLVGNARRNTLFGNDGNNILKGGSSVDNLYGGKGNDTLYGGAGKDWLYGGEGNDKMYGGDGNDTYVFDKTNSPIYKTKIKRDENGNAITEKILIGYEKKDDVIIPGAGKDTLRFQPIYVENSDGDETATQKIYKDDLTYFNKNGDLVVKYNYHKVKLDEETNLWEYDYDTVTVKDYFKKGLYQNVAWLDDAKTIEDKKKDDKSPSYKFLSEVTASTIQYDIDTTIKNTINGTKFDDKIISGNHDDVIKAGAGADIIDPGAGDDTIRLGAGNDTLSLKYGNNKVYLDSGANTVKYSPESSGYDTIYSGKGEDIIELTSKERGDLKFGKTPDGKSLIIYYDEHFSSITIADYFKKQGKTSIQAIKLADDKYLDLVAEYSDISSKANTHPTGGYGCDTITDGNLKINTLYDGVDTIKVQKAKDINVDLSELNLTMVDNRGFVDGYTERYNMVDENYAFSKQKNDLVINYGKTLDQESMSRIILQNYFKLSSKVAYTLKINNSTEGNFDLKEATIYFEGLQESKNKITGSNQNDLIYGGKLNDTIKAGTGDDVIYAGKGDDAITGGAGRNEIHYEYGDGADTITLSKNEQLSIMLKSNDEGTFSPDKLSYEFDKKGNLLINYDDEKILTIKNFKKKDITGANGSVVLYMDNAVLTDFKDDIFTTTYKTFTKKKYSYTGKWYSEYIDASNMISPVNKKNKGVTIKAGAGDDIVIGSDYNDTLKGGNGDDLIVAGNGKNTVDGGNGDDAYYLFYDDNLTENYKMKADGKNSVGENTTINDTGVSKLFDSEGNVIKEYNDKAYLFTNHENLNNHINDEDYQEGVSIWFNADTNGEVIYNTDKKGVSNGLITYYIEHTKKDDDGNIKVINTATVTGVENIVTEKDIYTFNEFNENLQDAIKAWFEVNKGFNGRTFTCVADVIKYGTIYQKESIKAVFEAGWVSGEPMEEYDSFSVDNYTYKGKWYDETIDASALTEATEIGGVSINGGAGDDWIFGTNNNDILIGGLGDDIIYGGEGNDVIYGDAGDDHITLGSGDNMVYAGSGDNYLTSGSGHNTFVFKAGNEEDTNTIYNFDNNDKIRIDSVTDLVFKNLHGNLAIGYGSYLNDEILIADYFNNIDTEEKQISVLQYDGTYTDMNIKEDAEIEVNLDGYTGTYTATGYKEIFTGTGSISGIGEDDSIKLSGYNIHLSRNLEDGNNNDLIVKDVLDTITVEGFFNNPADFTVNDKKSKEYTIDVTLGQNSTYIATDYNEDITIAGNNTLSNLSENDKLIFARDTEHNFAFSLNGNSLAINNTATEGNTRTVTVSDYATNFGFEIEKQTTKTDDKGNETTTIETVDLSKYGITVSGLSEFNGYNTGFGSANITGTLNDDNYTGTSGNDNITAGNGNDVIYAGKGKNTVDGGNGDDTYHLFKVGDDLISGEHTTIDDTGTSGVDKAFVYGSKDSMNIIYDYSLNEFSIAETISLEDLLKNSSENLLEVMLNGRNSAEIKKVEEIYLVDGENNYKFNMNVTCTYDESTMTVKQAVEAWMTANNFANITEAINGSTYNQFSALTAIYANAWEKQTPTP